MKHLFSLALFCLSLGGFAQNWAPFPLDETSEWRVHHSFPINWDIGGWQCEVYHEYNFSLNDSVFVDGEYYLNFAVTGMSRTTGALSCANPWNSVSFVYPVYLRTEDGVYYRKQGTNPEEVVADFNQQIGDTVPNSSHVIDSIDVVNLNGDDCKLFWTSATYWPFETLWMLESVGTSRGTFLHNFFEGMQNLDMCYREFGVPAYVDIDDIAACSITGVESKEKDSQWVVSPNPSSGIFRIETTQKTTYRIYDLFGRMIREGHVDGTSEIDLSAEPSGIYLISVENEKGTSTAKLVKQ